jgi:ribosomal-protein-alanine N-acetyltransferase
MKHCATAETYRMLATIYPAMAVTSNRMIPGAECPSSGEVFRPMTAADLSQVHALECLVEQDPWSPEHFVAELGNPFSQIDLCWRNGQLAGFICTWLVAGEAQIQNVATAPAFRRQGVAARLLTLALERCRAANFEAAWLEVRAGNAAAIALYERFGFRRATCRPGYYADGEDAVVMCLNNS